MLLLASTAQVLELDTTIACNLQTTSGTAHTACKHMSKGMHTVQHTQSLLLLAAGTQTQQSTDEPLTANEQRSQSATAPRDPETSPAESQPSNPPAETNGNEPNHHHAVATVTDAAAVSSVVGANQPMADDSSTADVAPAEQAMTTKAEPGDPVSVPGTVDTVAAAAAAQVAVVDVPTHLTDEERRLLDWHWANLEYGCSARLSQVCFLI